MYKNRALTAPDPRGRNAGPRLLPESPGDVAVESRQGRAAAADALRAPGGAPHGLFRQLRPEVVESGVHPDPRSDDHLLTNERGDLYGDGEP